ncbi:MAG: hypothetical protein HY778_15210 [Betaproteobacteria bacterium]|nr:hypothetical protein [Betaproteobacteria bacterium]
MARLSTKLPVAAFGLLFAAAAGAGEWEGWLVGEPCAAAFQVADCPLRHVDRPVLLLESGEKLAFAWGEGRAVDAAAVDKSYAKKVRLTGELKAGVIAPVKLDVLELSGEKKFFKGCL